MRKALNTKLSSAAAFSFVLLFGLISPAITYAASANMYLSALSNSVAKGQNLTIGVRVNSGSTQINAVQANLTYPADKFDFVSINPDSTFPVESESSGGNGNIRIGRGIIGSVSGDKPIASFTLKAKNIGTAVVKFASGSSAAESGSNTPVQLSTGDATYTITEATAASGAGVANDKIPPKISDVKVSDIGYKSVKLTWQTSEPAQTEISYGSNKSYGISMTDNSFVTDHSMTLDSSAITPATEYHYKITNTDTAGNAASTPDSTFSTKGSVIAVKVVGSSNRPVKGALVTVDNSVSLKTDKDGNVTFGNLRAGEHTIVAQAHDKSSSVKVTTSIPQSAATPVKIQLDIKQISTTMALLIVVVLAILAILIARQLKKSNRHDGGADSGSSSEPEVPIEKVEARPNTLAKKTANSKKVQVK